MINHATHFCKSMTTYAVEINDHIKNIINDFLSIFNDEEFFIGDYLAFREQDDSEDLKYWIIKKYDWDHRCCSHFKEIIKEDEDV